ncbi:MAG: tryptophan--tRNA ligase [Patescibacteria group bacterium]
MPTRILTGDRPTGPLHLGHYAGSLSERLRYQNEVRAECYFIIADYQVMTDREDTSEVEKNIFEVMLDYLAVGIVPYPFQEPSKGTSVVFIQSRVPQLAELFMFFSMITTMAKVGRNPTVKEEVRAAGLESRMSLGMFSYPVSQAADILLFQPDYVPVGEDQVPHIEMTRGVARTFNNLYGETFKLPEVVISNVPRLLGLDASQKMSKSRGNAIYLSDDADTVRAKIKTAVTDSGREVVFDLVNKPAISNLLVMYQLATGTDMADIEHEFAGKGYGHLKARLTEALNSFLSPIRMRRRTYAGDKLMVAQLLKAGTERAIVEGEKTMQRVREAMKYNYPHIFDNR